MKNKLMLLGIILSILIPNSITTVYADTNSVFTKSTNTIPAGSIDQDPDKMRVGDFNKDGRSDAYFYWKATGQNRLYFSNGDGSFLEYLNPIPVGEIDQSPDNLVVGDFNGDGRSDVYFHWKATGQNRLYLSNGNGTFTGYMDPIIAADLDANPDNMLVGDFNGDGRSDVYFHWKSTGRNWLYFSNGDGTFIKNSNSIPEVQVDASPDNMLVGDFNGDGRSDVYFHWKVTGINRLYFFKSDGTFTGYMDPIIAADLDANPDNMLAGDFNGDGSSDVYFHWKATGRNWLYFSNGNGTFIKNSNPIPEGQIDESPDNMQLGDFNGDGRSDVYFHWKATGKNRLYFNKGNGTFTGYMDPIIAADLDANPDNLRISDFNGDGRSDVYFHWKSTGRNWLYFSNLVVLPSGGITNPIEGATIGTGQVALSAAASAGGTGNGVQSVTFKVLYDGVWHVIGTDTTAPYETGWTPPTGLRTQQIIFTLDLTDSAGMTVTEVGGRRVVNFIENTTNPGVIENYVPISKRAYLNQRSLTPYGDSKCGSASAAMMLAINGRIGKSYETMRNTANAIYPDTLNSKGEAIMDLIVNEMKERGLASSVIQKSPDNGWIAIKSEINAGRPVILNSRKVALKSGHFFVVVGYREEGSKRNIIVYDPYGRWLGVKGRYNVNDTSRESAKGRWVTYDLFAIWDRGYMITGKPNAKAMADVALLEDDVPDVISEEPLEEADYEGILIDETQFIFLPFVIR
jgi:hypothetical protein